MEIPWSSKLGVEERLLTRRELCLSKCSGQFPAKLRTPTREESETRRYESFE